MRNRFLKPILILSAFILFALALIGYDTETGNAAEGDVQFYIEQDETAGTISIYREGQEKPALVQNAATDHRPYLHPIMAPDGNGSLTEFSPEHHKHQTGLYWGFTRINGTEASPDTIKALYKAGKFDELQEKYGRDYFHHPAGDYWQQVSATVLQAKGRTVKWQTVYNMLDEAGNPIMLETQIWSMQEQDGKYLIDLLWSGEAKEDITIGQWDYGGLFLRMPWREGINGKAVNSVRQVNGDAEGQRAIWLNVGLEIEGREDFGHIAIFDNPKNDGYPQYWRVDNQLGVGPAPTRSGDIHIKAGSTEIIRHRLVAYTGTFSDLDLTKMWQDYVRKKRGKGAESDYAVAVQWGLANKEAYQAEFLTAQQTVDITTVKDGFKVNAYASEPMITQPMAFCWDDRGRIWIAENRDFESSAEGFSQSGESRILILEDTDGDGVADTRKVFADSIPFPSAIAVGFDGLFLGTPPHLLFIPDRDGDDKADMEDIEIRLTGWGIRDRHEVINSLHWGPDGWLYGCEGFATPSKIRKPGPDARLFKPNDPFPEELSGETARIDGGAYWKEEVWTNQDGVDFNGGVFRYHPIKDRFEVVAHGFSNPWGIDYDAKGQLFISACVIPHLWHVVPGGYFHRQGGQHFNPYVYSDIQTIVDHRHRSAHGGARVYQSDAFPAEQRGRLFMANIHEHAVLSDVLEPKGSGFVARHGEDFMKANNAQWVGFSMEIGPEGGIYVLDWHDTNICGDDVLNKDTGRIYRILPENSLAKDFDGRYADVKAMSDLQLANLQTSESDWHSRRARINLQHRATKGPLDDAAIARLKDIYDNDVNADWRLRAMWALHLTNAFTTESLAKALDDKDQHIRAWAIQLLCEDETPSAGILARFAEMAANDESAVVRLYLASALQRLTHDARWDIAANLSMRAEDSGDHNIPKMIWYGLEPLVPDNPERALAVAGGSQISLLSELIVRRAVDADQTALIVAHLEKSEAARPFLLKGLYDALEGGPGAAVPENWDKVYAVLQEDERVAEMATAVAQRFGDAAATKKYLELAQDPSAPAEQRQIAIKNLAAQQQAELFDLLPALIDDAEVRIEALRAMASYESWSLGLGVIEKYDTFSDEEKLEMLQAYASRPAYGWLISRGLREGKIPKSDIPPYLARQIRRVAGDGFVEIYGPIDELPGNKALQYARYEELLTDRAISDADPANGKKVFTAQCGACHQMYDEGGKLGPDLTGSNRANLDYILNNVIDPNGDIQEDYKMVVATTRDGRTYAGNVVNETDRQLYFRIVGQDDPIVVNKANIQSREVTQFSMMPEGIFNALSDDEVLDLMAFLRTTAPLQ